MDYMKYIVIGLIYITMKYIKLISEFINSSINEGINDDYLYYLIKLPKLLNILKNNKINLGTKINATYLSKHKLTDKPFHLVLSRTPNTKLGSGRILEDRIVFNKSKLKSKFQIIPYDSWGDMSSRNIEKTSAFQNRERYKSTLKDMSIEQNYRYEYEEWLMSNKSVIDNITSYIERIDLLVNGYDERHTISNNYINRIVNVGNELGIRVFVYKNKEDLSYGRNAIKAPDYIDIGYYHGEHSEDFDWTAFVALILYDQKYLGGSSEAYDACIKDAEEYARVNDIPLESGYKVYEKIKDLSYLNNDTLGGLSSKIHNFFLDDSSGKPREKIHLLTNEMKKYKCRTIEELYRCKVSGLRPMYLPKRDWSSVYQLAIYHKKYWDDDKSLITFNPIPNENKFNSLRNFYYQTYNYGGQFNKEDFTAINDIDREEKPISSFINFLFNKYTVEKATEMIYKTGYDSYDKVNYYKVVKIKDR